MTGSTNSIRKVEIHHTYDHGIFIIAIQLHYTLYISVSPLIFLYIFLYLFTSLSLYFFIFLPLYLYIILFDPISPPPPPPPPPPSPLLCIPLTYIYPSTSSLSVLSLYLFILPCLYLHLYLSISLSVALYLALSLSRTLYLLSNLSYLLNVPPPHSFITAFSSSPPFLLPLPRSSHLSLSTSPISLHVPPPPPDPLSLTLASHPLRALPPFPPCHLSPSLNISLSLFPSSVFTSPSHHLTRPTTLSHYHTPSVPIIHSILLSITTYLFSSTLCFSLPFTFTFTYMIHNL